MSIYTDEYLEKWEGQIALRKADAKDQLSDGIISQLKYDKLLNSIRVQRRAIKLKIKYNKEST